MRAKRRKIPGDFKARVALAAIRGDRTISEIAAKFEVHPNQIRTWRQQLLDAATDLFADRRGSRRREEEELVAELYQQIGQLKVELDWLKKKSGLDD